MLDTKNQQKALVKDCNVKAKTFMNKCSELYKFIDEKTPWEVAGKILLFIEELMLARLSKLLVAKLIDKKLYITNFCKDMIGAITL